MIPTEEPGGIWFWRELKLRLSLLWREWFWLWMAETSLVRRDLMKLFSSKCIIEYF